MLCSIIKQQLRNFKKLAINNALNVEMLPPEEKVLVSFCFIVCLSNANSRMCCHLLAFYQNTFLRYFEFPVRFHESSDTQRKAMQLQFTL